MKGSRRLLKAMCSAAGMLGMFVVGCADDDTPRAMVGATPTTAQPASAADSSAANGGMAQNGMSTAIGGTSGSDQSPIPMPSAAGAPAPTPAVPPAPAGNAGPNSGTSPPVVIVREYTDTEIAAVLLAANAGEIEESQLATTRADNTTVREYAAEMIREHTAATAQARMLFDSLDLVPDPNDTSRMLVMESEDAMRIMLAETGADFDRTYMSRQRDAHRSLLSLLDMSLIESVVSVELRMMLEQLRPTVAEHLAAAEEILSGL
jgi:putative membrane protein